MAKINFTCAMGSPALLICGVFVALGLTANWYRTYAALTPPHISGYDWAKHPNVLLVSYPPDDCNCGAAPSKWVRAALRNGLDVVVIASRPNRELDVLQKTRLSAPHLAVFPHTNPDLIKSLSPNETTTGLRVRNGRIIRSAEGNLPPDTFFQ